MKGKTMKIISIGSSKGCNIHIDSEDISKRHALIYLSSTGKLQLVDTSENGTYINGVRVKSHLMTPVHRKDRITFANGHQLDWKKIPNPSRKIRMAVVCVAASICLLSVAYLFIQNRSADQGNPIEEPLLIASDPEAQSSQKPKQVKTKVDDKAPVSAKKDSTAIPSAKELWIGSGKKLIAKKKTKHPSEVSEGNVVSDVETENPQIADTIVEEEPSGDLEIFQEPEDGETY